MRVLISAFAISPKGGSEGGVGWQFASRLAEHHDVTVLYGDLSGRGETKLDLESWLREHPDVRNLHFHYVAPSDLSIFFERLHAKPGLRLFYYWGYQLWQRRAWKTARILHEQTPFTLVHQLTYATFWEPGYLWRLEVPYFWGPISGGSVIPLKYIGILGFRGALEAVARFVIHKFMTLTRPRIASASRVASHIWCVTNGEQRILSQFSTRISIMSEVGTAQSESRIRKLSGSEPMAIVWSGLHVPRKALTLLIRCLGALPKESTFKVHILGAGREDTSDTARAKAMAARLGVESKCEWHGTLPREKALAIMNRAHVLVHTSLLEGTPWVVIEALSSGLPVICHNVCGMGAAVTPDCGIKVPMTGIKDSVRGFARAIQVLLDHPAELERLSRGAIERSRELTWEKKITEINEEYEKTLRNSRYALKST